MTFLFVGKIGWALNAKGKIILKPYLSPSVVGFANFRVYNFLNLFNLPLADHRHLAVIHKILYLMCIVNLPSITELSEKIYRTVVC